MALTLHHFLAYRSLFVWLRREGSRSCLPSCVSREVKKKYPSPNYTGDREKSPVFTSIKKAETSKELTVQ